MDGRIAVLDLKDVPPPPAPPHHSSSSQTTQRFSLAPLPMPPPCMPPPPQLPPESHQQQPPPPQQQEGASPKVSTCSYCDYCGTGGYETLGGASGVSSSSSVAGAVSFYRASSTLGTPSTNNNVCRAGLCSVASSVEYKHNLSCGSRTEALAPLVSLGYTSQLPSSVATSQPVSSHPCVPYCPGLLHSYPGLPLSCSQPNPFPSSAPLGSSLSSLNAPLHGSCLASSGYYSCGVDCSPLTRRSQRSTALGDQTTTTITTTTTSSHYFSNPMHLNVKRTVCVKGAHYCQECLFKVGTFYLFFSLLEVDRDIWNM